MARDLPVPFNFIFEESDGKKSMQLVDDNLKEFENSTPRIVITSCEDVAMIDRTGEVDESI